MPIRTPSQRHNPTHSAAVGVVERLPLANHLHLVRSQIHLEPHHLRSLASLPRWVPPPRPSGNPHRWAPPRPPLGSRRKWAHRGLLSDNLQPWARGRTRLPPHQPQQPHRLRRRPINPPSASLPTLGNQQIRLELRLLQRTRSGNSLPRRQAPAPSPKFLSPEHQMPHPLDSPRHLTHLPNLQLRRICPWILPALRPPQIILSVRQPQIQVSVLSNQTLPSGLLLALLREHTAV